MSEPDALRRARLQQAQLELEVRFRTNLDLLRQVAPSLHETARDHRPKGLCLTLAEGGWIDLANLRHGGKPVYAMDPRQHAAEELAAYRAKPMHGRVRTVPAKILDEAGNVHMRAANQAIEALLAEPPDTVDELPAHVDFMLLLGLGLGHQLELLVAEVDVAHLCLVEPDFDVFHASLHTADWGVVLSHFCERGRSLELVIGVDAPEAGRRIARYVDEIGPFHVAQPFVYEHASSRALVETKRAFFDQVLPGRTNHLGYFDDERIGLVHSIENHRAGTPVLADHSLLNGDALDVPAFLVANGPSLDEAIGFLAEHRDRAVVFSSGTALGSLVKAGITPDFHVEMERSRPVLEWISSSTDPGQREDVTLLTLNTVHPDVLDLFPRRAMAMKPNDAGARFLSRYARASGSVIELGDCNPTVANCALAYAAALGFRDVYLFGLDLGFSAGARHHSALSLHYEIADERHGELGVYAHDDARNLTAPGNFGGSVGTTRVYKSAAQAVTRVIEATPGLRCHNTSRGIRIEGAEPTPLSDLALPAEPLDRPEVTDRLFRRYFGREGLRRGRAEDAEEIFARARQLLGAVRERASSAPRSLEDALATLQDLHALVTDAEAAGGPSVHAAGLVNGSVSFFSLVLAQAIHRFRDVDRSLDLYQACLESFLAFVADAEEVLASDPLARDTRSRGLTELLGAS